ncbi:condensation domain-containing protein [Streptomyces flavidovirens]|uniref:condensation domain-containing protein n=1 Tax=Streptomyces flavidovirens TaxID=67298 RepID=UPI00341D4D45
MNRAPGEAVYEGPEREFTDDDPPNAVSALLRAAERSPHAGSGHPRGRRPLTHPALPRVAVHGPPCSRRESPSRPTTTSCPRARLSEAGTFADLVSGLGGTVFNALDDQALPLNEIVRLLAPEEADGLFPTVLFTVVTTPPPALHLRGVSASIRGVPVGNIARNELYVVLVPRAGSITMTFEYSTDLFDAATITRWAQEFTRQLALATASPEMPLPDLISTEGPSPKG